MNNKIDQLVDSFESGNCFNFFFFFPSSCISLVVLTSTFYSFIYLFIFKDAQLFFWFQVYINTSSLNAHFSPSIYAEILGLIAYLGALQSALSLETIDPLKVVSNGSRTAVFGFSTNVKLETVSFQVELENEKEINSSIMLACQQLDIRYLVF